jgi:hypothetical protein
MSDVIDRLRSVDRAVCGSILAVAALLVSVILMILPLSTTSTTYQWNPSNSSDSGAFPLDRSWPQSMVVDATFRCDDVNRVVLSTGGFQLSCQKNAIVAKSGKTILGPVNGTDGDSIRFAFTGETGDAVLSNLTTDESSSKQLKFSNFPIVHKLASLSPIRDELAVTVTARPSSLDFDIRRWLLAGLAIGLAIGSAFAFRRAVSAEEGRPTSLRRFWPHNVGVLTALGIAALGVPMFFDDGWVIQRVTQFLHTGYFGDFYYHSNGWLPQGFLTEFVLSLFIGNDFSYLGLRMVIVIVLWLSWLVVLAAAVRLRESITPLTVWLAATVYVSVAAVFGTSLRAESWVGLFTASCLYFIFRYLASNSTPHLFAAGAFAGLAAAAHQSGFVAFVGFLVLVAYSLHKARWRPTLELFVVGTAVLASTLAFFFVGYDLTTVIAGAREFSGDAYSNRLDEFFRIGQFAGNSISGARRFAVVVIVATLALALSSVRQVRGINQQMLIILLLSPIGLLLTASKWGWHIAVLAVPAALITLILVRFDMPDEQWARPRFVVILPVVAMLAGVSLAQKGRWGSLDHSSLTWSRFSERVAGPDTQWWWLGAIVLLIVIGGVLDQRSLERGKPRALGASIAVFGLLLPSAASGAWIFADTYLAKTNDGLGWTILGQNVDELTRLNSGACGSLGTANAFTTGVKPLTAIPNGSRRQLLMQPTGTEGLGFDDVDGWQTVPGDQSAVSSQSYVLPPTHDAKSTYALWFNFAQNERDFAASIDIVATQANEQSVVRNLDVGSSPEQWMWSKIEFSLPDDSESVRVVVTTDAEMPFVVTQPVIDLKDTAANVLSAGTVFVGPSTLPSVPCAQLPSASEGLFPATPFIVLETDTRNFLFSYFPLESLSITELNETRRGVPGIGKVEYDSADSLTSSVAVTSTVPD